MSRDRRRARCRLRRLRPRARCAPPDGLAREALHLSHRARERPLQRRDAWFRMRRSILSCRTARTGSRRTSRTRPTGRCRVVRALAESLNLATVGVGLEVGLPKIAQTLQRFGLPQPPVEVPAMLLGAVEVTPLEAAQLFNGLANGGFRNPLRAVRAVIGARRQGAQGLSARGDAGGLARRTSTSSIGCWCPSWSTAPDARRARCCRRI